MASMKRRLFNILAAISLALCLATAGVWVRSYWQVTGWMSSDRCCGWKSTVGSLLVWRDILDTRDMPPNRAFEVPGLEYWRGVDVSNDPPSEGFVISYWLLCTLMTLLPAIWLRREIPPAVGSPR